MHVSQFLNAKCLVQVAHPWRLWTFCGRCYICPCEDVWSSVRLVAMRVMMTAIQLLSMVRATPRLRPHNDAVVWTSVAQWQSMVLNSNFLFWNQACHGIVLKSSMSWHRDLLQTFADIVKYSSWARMWTNVQDAFRSVWTWGLVLNLRKNIRN